MKRTLLLFAFLVACCLTLAAASAQAVTPSPVPGVQSATAAPPVDPYLGGEIATRVPMARVCRDWGQCEFQPNGDPCDTPVGCVCGWGGGQRRCGRW